MSAPRTVSGLRRVIRSEEHTSELQSRLHLVCRLLLEKKIDEDRLVPFVVFAALAATTTEYLALVVAGLGIWYSFARGRRLNGAVIAVACFFIDPVTTEIYTLSLHDALPI